MPEIQAGDMNRRVHQFDWSATSLGPLADWPNALKTLVDLVLTLPMPAIVLWGPDLIEIYNDAHARLAGAKHPAALGRPASENWPEVGHVDAPVFERVLAGGESLLLEDRPFPAGRNGVAEDAYFTASYSPVRDDAGRIAGIFLTIVETTARVRAERDRDRQEEQRREDEAALRESEGRYRTLVTASASVVYRMNADWSEMRRLYGRGLLVDTAVPDPSWMESYIPPENRPRVLTAIGEAIRSGQPFDLEHRVWRADGTVGWTHSRAVPLLDDDGEVVEWFGAATDMTGLKDAEQRLHLALGAARMGTWRWALDDEIHRRDANLNRLLGRAAEESEGPLADFLACIHPDDRDRISEAFHHAIRRGSNTRVEFRVVWPDGTVRWLRDQGDVFGGPQGRYLAGACVDVTDLVEAEAALLRANDTLEARVAERTAELEAEADRRRDLARRLVTAQEDERRRVSRDLHDSAGQLLVGLGLAFKAAEAGDLPPRSAGKLAEARHIVEALTREIHDLAVRLRPTSLDDVGLEPALGQLVAEWSARTGTRADFRARGIGPGRLTPEVETAIYRAVQEALTNVAKHAGATAVSVTVVRPDGMVIATIEDDGSGFDPRGAARGRFGLAGMRERVASAGGEAEVESAPGSGTTVFLRFPIS